ncbi:MAG: hypothetical protein Q8O30_12295 [Candidatus Omnitrophota bacterium]|nr:hypothetical protein [Candidatus Omnitrophota bacterium]
MILIEDFSLVEIKGWVNPALILLAGFDFVAKQRNLNYKPLYQIITFFVKLGLLDEQNLPAPFWRNEQLHNYKVLNGLSAFTISITNFGFKD